jgi:CDP-4-dehydro-6-deoxyglucose reductase
MIASGRLRSFDGLVELDDLQREFPDAALADSGAFETVARIREEAFARRVQEFVLPSQEVLAQRLLSLSVELAQVRRHLQAYHELVVQVRERIGREAGDAAAPPLLAFVDERLKRILASEPEPFEESISMLEAITAHVTVRPSGRQFLVEGNESILQAGLKGGAQFAYGCGTGACGLCKARVIAGDVRPIAHSDYPLSEQERQQGYTLLCTHTAVSDLIVETLEARGPQDIPKQEIPATVRAISPLAPDTLLLHVQTPRSHRLRFLAGQSATLGIAAPDGDRAASLPLASCPCDERNLHFHVAREDASPLAAALFDGRCKAGDRINVRGPFGQFVLRADDQGRAPIFVACDTAFAPVKSLIEHAIAADQFDSISLYWLATRPDGHYLANQCRAWAASLDQFGYTAVTACDPASGGRELATRIATERKDLAQCTVYAAGAKAFVEAVVAGLVAGGLKSDQTVSLVL